MKIGDKLEKIIELTIPLSLIDRIKKNGCNCKENKEWLNSLTEKIKK